MIDRTNKSYILESTVRDPRFQGNGRIRRFLKRVAVFAVAVVILAGIIAALTPLVIDAAEREAAWRADRLCKQGYYCDPKAGP